MYLLLEMYQGKCFLVEEVFEGAGAVPGQLNKHTVNEVYFVFFRVLHFPIDWMQPMEMIFFDCYVLICWYGGFHSML